MLVCVLVYVDIIARCGLQRGESGREQGRRPLCGGTSSCLAPAFCGLVHGHFLSQHMGAKSPLADDGANMSIKCREGKMSLIICKL